MIRITTTKIIATIGKNIETTDIVTAVPVSTVDTIGLAKPPVEAVDAKRVTPDEPEMALAVPAPAIIANAHVITGLKSTTVDNITTVPAKAAKGTEIVSNKLSTYGI